MEQREIDIMLQYQIEGEKAEVLWLLEIIRRNDANNDNEGRKIGVRPHCADTLLKKHSASTHTYRDKMSGITTLRKTK